jgi:hypothetical protein
MVKMDIIIPTRKGNIVSFLKNKMYFCVTIKNQTTVLNLRIEASKAKEKIVVFWIVTPERCHNPEDHSLVALRV